MSSVPGRRNVYLIGTGQDRELASTALQARGRLELSLDVVSHEALLQYYFITSKVFFTALCTSPRPRTFVQVMACGRVVVLWLIHTDTLYTLVVSI